MCRVWVLLALLALVVCAIGFTGYAMVWRSLASFDLGDAASSWLPAAGEARDAEVALRMAASSRYSRTNYRDRRFTGYGMVLCSLAPFDLGVASLWLPAAAATGDMRNTEGQAFDTGNPSFCSRRALIYAT